MELLEKVKANLILQHNEDDALLQEYIKAAVAYAESYQKKPEGYYAENPMLPAGIRKFMSRYLLWEEAANNAG
jgi:hypothetical protein